jgi:outer membrane receptor protein involved in Fe transport
MIKVAHFKFILVFISLQVIINNAFALNTSVPETAIKGTVIDSTTHNPIEFANAVLFNDNKDVIAGSMTSMNGTFEFKNVEHGKYILCISIIGYKKYISKEFYLKRNETIDLGNVFLQDESSMLGEVVIKSKAKLIQNNGDKVIYNAKADLGNKAGSATDVLRNTPMVTVDAKGEIKLRGNANITILLNGLPSSIMAKNIKEALKSIPAATIESIEVITTPSAKYEAEGSAGIINIVTKKKSNGTNGSIDLTAGNLEQSMNAEISLDKEKFNYDLSFGLMQEKESIASELNRTSLVNGIETGKLIQNTHAKQRYKGTNIEFSTEYQADSTQKMGASISYWNDKMPMNSSFYNSYENMLSELEYNQTSEQKMNFNLIDISLNYQKKFKQKGQELQLVGQYGSNVEKSSYQTNQVKLTGQPYFAENGSNTSKNNDLSFQTDYSHPIAKTGKSILETGMRYGRSSSASEYSVLKGIHNDDASPSDDMNYSQNIYASYLSLKFETNNKWIIRPGLRYEATQLHGNLNRNATSFNASFDNWVPSFLISKKMGENHDVKLNYTERIRRPEIWDLNPYVNASDPQNIVYGNPHLRPETTRMVEFGYMYGNVSGFSINNSLFFNSNKNGIDYLSIVDSAGVSKTTSYNIAAIQRIGVNTNIYMPINENWNLSSDIEIYQVWFDSNALKVNNDAFFYSLGINSSYSLPSDFTVQVSADYNNGMASLQGKSSSYYSYRFSIGKELFKRNAILTLNVNNPFRNSQMQSRYLQAPTFFSKSVERYYDRSFTVSFCWRFGGFQSVDKNNNPMPDRSLKKKISKI